MWKLRKRTRLNEGTRKPVTEITTDDLAVFPVWEYANDEKFIPGRDETWMRPVTALPVSSLNNCMAAAPARLANGETWLAAMTNVDLDDPSANEYFLTIGIFRADGEQFVLARYHDFHRDTHGPQALSEFLGLPLDEIFPISYDLSRVASGTPAALRGVVQVQPKIPLSRRELMEKRRRRRLP